MVTKEQTEAMLARFLTDEEWAAIQPLVLMQASMVDYIFDVLDRSKQGITGP
ncbi:MAG: hypothetical protein K0Q50_717 [Vampirovibrio sp.]|jgi:hypothetical protein|nr:hypothetical protein [Vampirovibrio sp.]